MQVILVQDVPQVGSLGDQVQVKDGFARNYLLPRGMAIMAGSKRSGQIEHQRKRLERLRQEAIASAQAESDKVTALDLRVQAKAGVNGKLFGSVTNRDIQAVLAEQGYQLDRRSIQLHTLIKSVGNFTATVKLHTDVKVEVGIKVEAIGAPEAGVPADGEVVEGESAEENVEGEAPAAKTEASGQAEGEAQQSTSPAEEAGAASAEAGSDADAEAATAGSGGTEEPDDDRPETPASEGDAEESPVEQN